MKSVVSKLSLALVSLFLLITNANAASCSDLIITPENMGLGNGANFGGGEIYRYSFKVSSSGGSLTAYCHNPGVHPYDNADDTLKCNRVIFDPTNDNRLQNTYDAGLSSILNANSSKYNYNQKYIAVNLYEMLFPVLNTNGNNDGIQTKALKYHVNQYLKDEEITSKLVELSKLIGSYNVKTTPYVEDAVKCTQNCESSADMNKAKELVKQGLDEAIKFAKGEKEVATTAIGNAQQKRDVTTDDNGVKTYTQTVSYKIDIKNFKSDAASVRLKAACENCGTYGLSVSYYLNDKQYSSEELPNVNLVKEFAKDGEGEVTFKLVFAGTETNYNCEKISYNFDVLYYDASIGKASYEVSKCSNSQTCQGFYVTGDELTEYERTTSIRNTISLCNKEVDQKSCTTYLPNADCIECQKNVHNLDILEGYKYEGDVCDSKATLNIEECVANDGAVDTAGNTFKNTKYSKDTEKANTGVYCKEDYHMTMPGSIAVESGRYFTLKSEIKGTESCYTGKMTGKEAIIEAVNEAGAATVKAFNELSKARAIKECLDGTRSCTITHGTGHLPAACGVNTVRCYDNWCMSSSKKGEDGNMYFSVNKYQWYPTLTISGTSYEVYSEGSCGRSTEALNVTYNGSDYGYLYGCGVYQSETSATASFDDAIYSGLLGKIGSAATITGSRTSGDPLKGGSVTYTYKSGTGLLAELGTGGIYTILDEWNRASGFDDSSYPGVLNPNPFENGWKMSYNFQPEMYFWYQEEEYMKVVRTDKMDALPKTIGDIVHKYCVGEASADYEFCNNTDWLNELTIANGGVNNNTVCACNGDKCKPYHYIISNANYVKESVDASETFITPTQFYNVSPYGSPVTANQGIDIENAEEIINGLPVGLGTSATRTYVLWMEKLGEFYDIDKLGRVWGEYNSVIAQGLKSKKSCLNPNSALVYEDSTDGVVHSDGVYACLYSTQCCPDCPPEVVNKCVVTKDKNGRDHFYDDTGTEVEESVYKQKCCRDDDCPVTCKSCIYDGNKLLVDYRQISDEDLNPNDRDMGRNWKWDDEINTAYELKAYVTTKEIENENENIFDVDFSNPSSDNEFAMQVTMDREMISWIRKYNDRNGSNYLSNSLKCYDYKNGSAEYGNIYCYSTFIDDILDDDSKVKDKIKISKPRPMNEADRKSNKDKYFINWRDYDFTGWNIATENEVDVKYFQSHFGKEKDADGNEKDYYVGPSWK